MESNHYSPIKGFFLDSSQLSAWRAIPFSKAVSQVSSFPRRVTRGIRVARYSPAKRSSLVGDDSHSDSGNPAA